MIKGLYKAQDLGGGVGHEAIAENEAVGDKIPGIDLTIDSIKSMIRLEIICQKTIGIVETIVVHIGIDHTETDLLIAMITDINITILEDKDESRDIDNHTDRIETKEITEGIP